MVMRREYKRYYIALLYEEYAWLHETKAPGDWSVISKNAKLLKFYGVINDFQVGMNRLEPSCLLHQASPWMQIQWKNVL